MAGSAQAHPRLPKMADNGFAELYKTKAVLRGLYPQVCLAVREERTIRPIALFEGYEAGAHN